MTEGKSLAGVVEAYYTPSDLAALWRFSERTIRDMVKRGDFTTDSAEPLEIAGEIRIPASAINAYAARNTYAVARGIKARTPGELLRKAGGAFSTVG